MTWISPISIGLIGVLAVIHNPGGFRIKVVTSYFSLTADYKSMVEKIHLVNYTVDFLLK